MSRRVQVGFSPSCNMRPGVPPIAGGCPFRPPVRSRALLFGRYRARCLACRQRQQPSAHGRIASYPLYFMRFDVAHPLCRHLQ